MKKKLIIILVVAGVLIIAALLLRVPAYISLGIGSSHMAQNGIIDDYQKNSSVFAEVAKYLAGFVENVTIEEDKNDAYTVEKAQDWEVSPVEVDDKTADEAICVLIRELKYTHIVKDKDDEGNCILFVRKAGMGFEQGIAYTMDGNKPNWPLINVLEPIEGNWYYYESE